MKTLNKKNIVLVVLSFVLALSMLAFAGSTKEVHAANENITHFVMTEETSIRIGNGAEGSGLRFRVQMDEATANYVKGYDKESQTTNENNGVTMGFIIAPKVLVDRAVAAAEQAGLTSVEYLTAVENYVEKAKGGIIVDKNKIYQEGSYFYANAVVNKLNDTTIDNNVQFTAIAYINDGTEVTYAVNEELSKGYKETASKAVLYGTDTLTKVQGAYALDDLGAETNPIQINDKAEMDLVVNSGDAYADLSLAIMTKDNTAESIPYNGTLDVVADQDNLSRARYRTSTAQGWSKGRPVPVESEDMPQLEKGPWSETPDMYKWSKTSGGKHYLAHQMNYTDEQYSALVEKFGITSFKFTYAVETNVDEARNWSWSTDTQSILAPAYSTTSEWNASHEKATQLRIGYWQTHIFPIEDIYAAIFDGNMLQLVSLYSAGEIAVTEENPIYFYMSSIEFCSMTEEEIENHVVYKGPIGFTPTADNISRYHDGATTKDYEKEFVTQEQLADIKGVTNPTAYTGDAVHMISRANNTFDGVASNYTAEEVIKLHKLGYFNTVTFNFMTTTALNHNDQTTNFETGVYTNYTILSAAGHRPGGDKSRSFAALTWYTGTIVIGDNEAAGEVPIERFVNVMKTIDSPAVLCFRFLRTQGSTTDIYFGNFIVT